MEALALVAVAGLLFLYKLGRGALIDWDEAIYAGVAREIVRGHQWLTLYWQGKPFFEKPPLGLWMQAMFFQWLGTTELAARLGSALCGIGIVVLAWAIGRRGGGAAAGLFAGCVLLTTQHFDRVMREGMTDALLCLCIYVGVYAYARLRDEEPGWFCLLCAAIGAGAMVKSAAILVVPLAVGIDLLLRRRTPRIGWKWAIAGGLLLVAIAAPWHVWMAMHYGWKFFDSYVGYHLVSRATQVIEGSGGGPLLYLRTIAAGAFPWSFVVLFALARRLWRRDWEDSILWVLAGVVLLGYSLLPTKHDWYIVPIYPALAIETGKLLAAAGKRWRVMQYAAVAALAVGIVAAGAKLVARQGDALTNQVAELAAMAERCCSDRPLLIVDRPDSAPELGTPAAAFYSNRTTTLLETQSDNAAMDAWVNSGGTVDAIVSRNALPEVSQRYAFRVVAERDWACYGFLSRKR